MYNNILVVVDLTADSSFILNRAQQLADGNAALLTVMHVVEFVPMEPLGETVLPGVQIEGELLARARDKLAELLAQHGLGASRQIVTVGSIKLEIQQAAQQQGADLIVVGNHERHGLKELMNFTEDAVLHTAPCDVLAVHLPTAQSR